MQSFLVPVVGFSNATSRVVGGDGILKTVLDANQRTVTFVYNLVREENEICKLEKKK